MSAPVSAASVSTPAKKDTPTAAWTKMPIASSASQLAAAIATATSAVNSRPGASPR